MIDLNSTENLIKRINTSPQPHEAIQELRPGQQVRIQFAIAVRQLAMDIKADPLRWLDIYSIMDMELDRIVEEMFLPHLFRVQREARDAGYDLAWDVIREAYPEILKETP
jgi:hypothetical protein